MIDDDAHTSFVVCEGDPPHDVSVGPVYSAGTHGPLAVPTGRVFVRFREGVRAEQRRAMLAAVGFEIERTLPYAPHAAWLTPTQGGIAHALGALNDLEAMPDVAHVEPQLLMERALRR